MVANLSCDSQPKKRFSLLYLHGIKTVVKIQPFSRVWLLHILLTLHHIQKEKIKKAFASKKAYINSHVMFFKKFLNVGDCTFVLMNSSINVALIFKSRKQNFFTVLFSMSIQTSFTSL